MENFWKWNRREYTAFCSVTCEESELGHVELWQIVVDHVSKLLHYHSVYYIRKLDILLTISPVFLRWKKKSVSKIQRFK